MKYFFLTIKIKSKMQIFILFLFSAYCLPEEANSTFSFNFSFIQNLTNILYKERIYNKSYYYYSKEKESTQSKGFYLKLFMSIFWIFIYLNINSEFTNYIQRGVQYTVYLMTIIQIISHIFYQFFEEPSILFYLFSFNPYLIVEEKQYWRIITGQLFYLDANIFFCFNEFLFCLIGPIFEKQVGTTFFIFYIFIFMISIGFLEIFIHYIMFLCKFRFHFEYLNYGFSAVIFSIFPISRHISKKENKNRIPKISDKKLKSPSLKAKIKNINMNSPNPKQKIVDQSSPSPMSKRSLSPSPIQNNRSPSPPSLNFGGIPSNKVPLIPFIELFIMIINHTIFGQSFSSLICGVVVGNIFVKLFKNDFCSVNENFALIFNFFFPLSMIMYFFHYVYQ